MKTQMTPRLHLVLVTISLLFFCFACWTVYGQRQTAPKTIWEYSYLTIPYSDMNKAMEELNKHASKGWEVVQAAFPTNAGGNTVFLVRRAK